MKLTILLVVTQRSCLLWHALGVVASLAEDFTSVLCCNMLDIATGLQLPRLVTNAEM